MQKKNLVAISKYLSKHLRHQPERLGLNLEPGGWVGVDDLLAACERNNFPVSREELEQVVAENDKQRFSFDTAKKKIRANQGHSVEIDLQLEAKTPPVVLYHGTSEQNVEAIWRHGLLKMRRHHVHLSADKETALKVGARHGRPTIFVIDTLRMLEHNFEFFVSANNVWLTETVPPQFLSLITE